MTMMRRCLGMMSKMNSVVNRLAVIAGLVLVAIAGSGISADAANVTYHMRGLAAQSVGIDGNTNIVSEANVTYNPIVGTQWRAIASKTAPTQTLRNRIRESAAWNGWEQFLRVYSPLYASSMNIGANATASFDAYSAPGDVYAEIYEYNDTTGIVGGIKGTSNTITGFIAPSHNILTFNNAAFTVATGNRVVIYYYLNGQNADPRPIFGAAAYNSGTPAGDLYFVLNETAACTETATVNAVNPGVITGATAITATLGGIGGSLPQVRWSTDGGAFSAWQASGATLTPPINNAGTVIIEAQATGSCATITDSTPANTTYDTTCTEATPSSISFNGVTTAAGDFNGVSMVSPVDLNSLEFRVTEGSGGGAPFSQIDNFDANNFGNWTPTDTNTSNNWLLASGTTPSANVGPTADHTGGGFYAYTESSSGAYPETYWLTSNIVDASTYALNLDFWWNMNTDTDLTCELHVDVSADGGTSWTNSVWSRINNPNSGDVWVNQNVDLSAYTSNNVQVRFRTISSSWMCDTALDDIVISGPARATEVERLAWNLDPQEATAILTNGNSYNLYARGTDPECGTVYYVGGTTTPGTNQAFTWSSCTETATLTLNPITDPITGNVTVTATGTATGIQVGTSPSPTNASGWTYVPTQDDNTTTVSFYATGTGTCGTLTASQLNVGTNTMAAPTVTAFTIPATVVDTAAPLDVPITTFTASDNVAVTGYMITETATAPLAGDAGWSGTAPTIYTVPTYASYTLYAWAKDAAGNVSLSSSAPVTMSNCTEAGTVSLDLLPNPITGTISVTATVGGGAASPMISVDGISYSASPYSYTPPAQAVGTQQFWASATGTCATIYDAANPTSGNYDTRTNGTEAGTATAVQTALDTISVTMPYLGDKNADASFQVDYKLASGGTWTNGTPTLDTGGSPYTQNIAGLTSPETYDVRMTYADVDGVISGTATQQVVVVMAAWADNPMLHNSLRFTGTTKHGGNWGTPGNYAGGITCATCHAKNTGNVKRIQANISFPDGSAMPGGGTSAAVSLLTVEDGTSDFGDDSTAPRTSSNKVCEACHSADLTQANGVKQHAANQVADSLHYNNADCIKCHQHKAGFKADCTTCHGNPPVANTLGGPNGLSDTPVTGSATSGKHSLHAVTKAYACNTCHTGWEVGGQMPNAGNINIGFSAFGDTTASYDGRVAGSYTAAAGTTVGTGGALTCSAIYCHGTSTPKWLDTEPAMVCGSCHGNATNGAPIETAGDGDLAGNITGTKVGKHVKHIAKYACSVCHSGAGSGTALHVNGADDVVFDTAVAGASATFTAGTSTCSNLACHTNQVWDTTTPALACNSCHGYPPTSAADAANNRHASGAIAVSHDIASNGVTTAITGNHAECNTCHGKSQTNGLTDNTAAGGDVYLASYHIDGNIEMNGISAPNNSQSAEYDQTLFGCAKACHGNDAAHQLSDSGLPVQLHEFGAGSCDGCHSVPASGAPQVTVTSSHVDADGAGVTYTAGNCTDCHPGGTKGSLHTTGVGVVDVFNNATVGINYTHTPDGTNAGFALGGDATTGTTEAEICWNCHNAQTPKISEWGTNTEVNTGSSTYDYGNLTSTNSNWVVGTTGAEWNSANFAYKKGLIQSTHSVNSAGVSGKDAVADIRCSYCHDVHNTAGTTLPTAALKAADVSGAPYLRGSWKGNPYREDGAPLSGNTYASQGTHGNVPRGGIGATELGGYQIDLNNGSPTSTWSPSGATGFAGICILCHEGTGGTAQDGVWQAAEINGLNQFGTASTDWVGSNGHANSVKGGDGTGAANIFSLADRNSTKPTFGTNKGQSAGNPAMAYRQNTASGSEEYGWRNNSSRSGEGWDVTPLTTSIRAYEVANYTWGATVSSVDPIDPSYHKFSCSKCHNPHASRLPRLMITNCLDTKHNTWDTGTGIQSIPATNIQNGNGATPNASSASMPLSQSTSAQNCHRVRDPAFTNSRGAGWNNVTPW